MNTFCKAVMVLCGMLLAVGCANPLNQVTSDRYSNACAQAEDNGRLEVAEEACYRALVNVDMGNLGDAEKSEKMYNLARIKRQLRKYDEAVKYYNESLAFEERQPQPSKERIGRRLAELSIVYGEQRRFEEGLPYVERLYPYADSFQGNEKRSVAAIFYYYSQALKKQNPSAMAQKLANKATEMGYVPR